MSQEINLDIIVVSFNARDDLVRCLRSIEEAPPSCPHEIVVVDNASRDGSVDAVRTAAPRARVIVLTGNTGFARASNLGIRATGSELILLLNSDTIVEPGALDTLIDALVTTPEAAVAGPRLVDAAGRPEMSFGAMMTAWNELRQKRLGAAYGRGDARAVAYVEATTSRRGFPDWVSAACLLVWRRDAEAVGLLDERFFMYGEDVDFCAALRARGRRILFEPRARVVHVRGQSSKAAPEATAAAYRRSQIAFYEKHHPAWAPLLRAYLKLKGGRGDVLF